MKVLVIGPEAPGLPAVGWLREVSQIGEIPGVKLEFLGDRAATLGAVANRLARPADVVVWSGHGGPNRLLLSDGLSVDGEWLACQLRPCAPKAVILAACLSGLHDEGLQSLAETVSQAGFSTAAMWLAVEDRAASTYVVEFVRALAAGGSVAVANRVAGKMMAAQYPAMAGAAFLLPGLTNGYGVINERLARVESGLAGLAESVDDRLSGLEGKVQWIGEMLRGRQDTGR
jgi:hypothetical protein